MRKHLLLLATALLLALQAASAAGAASRATASVFLTGDSLSVGTSYYLPQILGRGRVATDARVGRPLAEGLAVIRAQGQRLPAVVVVSLGTNDDPRATGAFQSGIREVVRLAGPRRCVAWATVSRPAVAGTDYAGFNRLLAAEARHNRRFQIVDWAGLVSRQPALLAPDRVHGRNGSAYLERAKLTAAAVRRCSSALQAV